MQTLTFTFAFPDEIDTADGRVLVLTCTEADLTKLQIYLAAVRDFVVSHGGALNDLHGMATKEGPSAAWMAGPLALLRSDAMRVEPIMAAVCDLMNRATIHRPADLPDAFPTAGRA